MYLSRVEIDTKNRYKTRDLTHLGAFHNWVEQSFPKELATGIRHRHLWRLDTLAGKQYLLVLSETAPDADLLLTYGVPGTAVTKSYDPFLSRLQDGQLMQFRLTANPTHTISRPGQKQGRVVPHVTIAQQRQWLADRAEKSGFQLVEQSIVGTDEDVKQAFDIVSRDWPMLHRKTGRGVRLSRVTFEGLLRISDVAVFKQTLTTGLGREKAFGMGLMTVISENA
ncbi:type I-E CRISPR-associated protein Cas6/Cse3/CasE [Lactobacillus sp.] [Lactiplantibacillus mudanjiangensis]|uniref:type I-E CRISPR-associated protein Cas6/Cse3/CasE n=1 Tax=Lactiplantibacillus mudanjiangensis TaxID=1296538 RepID=UPI001015C8FE|nr:type I-E CRISPR-associated protein Cas6/Cse3/CasE [Lactiplantibacillus mudanjiangensis]VDG31925.1 type I-E CRISPR-associated protein Cas6/Cse3/CasE [Lactobacillus sp.] [Lactiplantibacillus mudanjiangensis]